MISKDEIKKLADLARIEIPENELESLAGEIDAILGYVGQVKSISGDVAGGVEVGVVKNVWREDANPTDPETYSKELIAEFPQSERNYLKVKKIL